MDGKTLEADLFLHVCIITYIYIYIHPGPSSNIFHQNPQKPFGNIETWFFLAKAMRLCNLSRCCRFVVHMRLDVARFSHLIDIIFDVLHLRIDLPKGIKDAAAKGEESKIFFKKMMKKLKKTCLEGLPQKVNKIFNLLYTTTLFFHQLIFGQLFNSTLHLQPKNLGFCT